MRSVESGVTGRCGASLPFSSHLPVCAKGRKSSANKVLLQTRFFCKAAPVCASATYRAELEFLPVTWAFIRKHSVQASSGSGLSHCDLDDSLSSNHFTLRAATKSLVQGISCRWLT